MGVIIRQGFKHSVVTFIAIGIGLINVLFIYTYVLSKEELGFIQYLLSIGQLLSPLILLGFNAVTSRYYPHFKNEENGNNGFLFILFIVPLLAYCLFSLIFYCFYQDLLLFFYASHPDYELIVSYFLLLPALLFALIANVLLSNYIVNFKRIVIPAILNNLWLKIAFPACSIAYFMGYMAYGSLIISIVVSHFITTIGLIAYLKYMGHLDLKPRFSMLTTHLTKEIRSYALFSVLGGVSSILATNIDKLMVGSLIDMENVGIYTIAIFIATVIGVPLNSVFGITSPIIANAFNKKDLVTVENLYKKTSLNLLILGVLLFTGIWASIDYLFDIIPNGDSYRTGKYVVFLLGVSKLVNMITSINTFIITYSDHYRFNLYIGCGLAILNIILNLLFIAQFALLGVALATLTSITIYNLIKFIFVYQKFNMQPFSWSMLGILGLGLFSFLLTLVIPDTNNAYLDILINSVVISLIYGSCILYFDFSEEITVLTRKAIAWVQQRNWR